MNFSDIFKNSFVNMFAQTNISTSQIFMSMLVTCVIALYIFAVYRLLARKTFYNKSFNMSLTAITLITAIVILTVQSNIVISLGMVGALSIVRFRTAVKDPMDLAFMFWAIAAGIACGASMIEIAIIGSLFITIMMFVLDRVPVARAAQILVINANAGADYMDDVKAAVEEHSKYFKVKSRNVSDTQLDVVVEVFTKDEDELVKAVKGLDKVNSVSLLAHDGEVTF